jgi:hypothetical protein
MQCVRKGVRRARGEENNEEESEEEMRTVYVLLTSYWNGDHYSDEDVEFAGWTEAEGRTALAKANEAKAVQRGDEQVRMLEMEIPEQAKGRE